MVDCKDDLDSDRLKAEGDVGDKSDPRALEVEDELQQVQCSVTADSKEVIDNVKNLETVVAVAFDESEEQELEPKLQTWRRHHLRYSPMVGSAVVTTRGLEYQVNVQLATLAQQQSPVELVAKDLVDTACSPC